MNNYLSNCKRINGNTLKIIACVVMLIDHITAGIMIPVVRNGLYPDSVSFEQVEFVYEILRAIGRNSFPIFCYLIVEGFLHTSSRLRYALGLLIFGIISEPLYDIVLYSQEDAFNLNIIEVLEANKPYLNEKCNVYFTLLLGLLAIWAIEKIYTLTVLNEIKAAAALITSAGFVFIAEKIHSDYHGFGVGLIIIFYVLRFFEPLNLFAGYVLLCFVHREYAALPTFILLFFYNKKRGRKLGNLKYLFYAFYPAHLLAIYFVRCIIYG